MWPTKTKLNFLFFVFLNFTDTRTWNYLAVNLIFKINTSFRADMLRLIKLQAFNSFA